MARSQLLVFSSLGGRLVSFYCWACAISFSHRAGPSSFPFTRERGISILRTSHGLGPTSMLSWGTERRQKVKQDASHNEATSLRFAR